jgi:hypothetical protein
MKTKLKITFTDTVNGTPIEFKDITVVKYQNQFGGSFNYYPTMMGISQVVRQTMKQLFPTVKFGIKTDSFSGGDSVRVNITSDVDVEQLREINRVMDTFEYGRFDAMTDYYDHKDSSGVTAEFDGKNIEFSTKYMFVQLNHSYTWNTPI